MFGLLSALLLFKLVGFSNVAELVLPHMEGQEVAVFQTLLYTINNRLLPLLPLMLCALFGLYIVWREKRWLLLYPLGWALAAYLFLLNHAPVWDHQQALVTIPAAMAAALVFERIGQKIVTILKTYRPDPVFILGFVLVFFSVFRFSFPQDFRFMSILNRGPKDTLIMSKPMARFFDTVDEYAVQTNWIVTDMPMFAFQIKKPIPPNLVVFTVKRLLTGNLEQEEIIKTIQTYRPEQVLLGRMTYASVEKKLKDDYTIALQEKVDGVRVVLYIRNDIVQPSSIK